MKTPFENHLKRMKLNFEKHLKPTFEKDMDPKFEKYLNLKFEKHSKTTLENYTRSRITQTRLYRIIAYFKGHLPHQKSLHELNVKKFCYIELK